MNSANAAAQIAIDGMIARVGPPHPRWFGILSLWWRAFLVTSGSLVARASGGRKPSADLVPLTDPDHDLLVAVLNEYPHGTRSFSELVHLYWGRIWTTCQSILLNEHDAEEAAQDTFLKVHRHLLTFRFESRFGTWTHRIARNAALTKLEARRRQRNARQRVTDDPLMAVWWIPRQSPSPGEPSPMWRALARLPPEDRLILCLREIEGWDYDEIAEVMGIAAGGAARMRLSRARERLRRAFTGA